MFDSLVETNTLVLLDITSTSWHDALPQADTVAQFVEHIENGTFDFSR